ncbi:STAS domain-containing protein [Streptomyces atroolivaceus]|uniref:STAS domain-containing protein n=1 Tax=Streptomyces atroolivaceus TaxID=66869 RepID=UPI00364B3413
MLRLRQALEAAAATQPLVILDAGAVTFADSTTLSLLLRTHRSTHFRIAAPPPALLPDAEGHRHRPGPGDPADRGSGTHFLTPNRTRWHRHRPLSELRVHREPVGKRIRVRLSLQDEPHGDPADHPTW